MKNKTLFQTVILSLVILSSLYATQLVATRSRTNEGTAQVADSFIVSAHNDAQRAPAQSSTVAGGDSIMANQPLVDQTSTQEAQTISRASLGTTPSDVVVSASVIPNTSDKYSCDTVGAELYLVKNIKNGNIVFEQRSGDSWPIASITKLVTAVVASDSLNKDTIVSITDAIQEKTGGQNTLRAQESYTVNDLLTILLLQSSNDAAYALADAFGYDEFLKRMNEVAKKAGMSHTTFQEVSGLSYLNQSTPNDLAKLLSYLWQSYPSVLEITRQSSARVVEQTSKKTKTISNIDYYAGRATFVGGKTGYIEQSRGNIIGIFRMSDDALYSVEVLGSYDRFKDMDALLSCASRSIQSSQQ